MWQVTVPIRLPFDAVCKLLMCDSGIVNSEIFARTLKIKPLRNGKITLSFIDIGKSCLSCDFFTSLICLLMLFTKIKFPRKFPNLQYHCISASIIMTWQAGVCFSISSYTFRAFLLTWASFVLMNRRLFSRSVF